MAGKVMFLRSNQGDRLDGNESVADSLRSDLVGFKGWSGRFLGAFPPSYVSQKNPPVGKRTRYPRSPLSFYVTTPLLSPAPREFQSQRFIEVAVLLKSYRYFIPSYLWTANYLNSGMSACHKEDIPRKNQWSLDEDEEDVRYRLATFTNQKETSPRGLKSRFGRGRGSAHLFPSLNTSDSGCGGRRIRGDQKIKKLRGPLQDDDGVCAAPLIHLGR
ncbi:hypothetical protein TNCV_4168661 [Trichonephila clavipes]|nr:hypothetical protein TNCV_4168661 [Trichonephila clavipes]